MGSSELDEHRRYHTDQNRTQAYKAALAAVVRPGDVVLDLGCGTGLLGFLALTAGADHVHAVDSGPIIGLARELARDAGISDRVTHHRASSTALRLEQPVDVVVCDQVGGFVHDAGVLTYYRDAADRLTHSGTRFVPAAFEFLCAPVQNDQMRTSIDEWVDPISGMDTSAALERAINTEHRIGTDSVHLAASASIGSRVSTAVAPATMAAEFVVESAGRMDGVVGYFTADMGGGVTMTNDPTSPTRINRWCNFYPIAESTEVDAGDKVRVSFDLRPAVPNIVWSVTIFRQTGDTVTFRHATLLGRLMSAEDIVGGGASIDAARADAARRALELVDGQHSVRQISDEVWAQHPEAFASAEHCHDVIGGVLGRLAPS